MLTRRATLVAAFATAGAAKAQAPAGQWDPTAPKPPPTGADAYGLNPFFKPKPRIEDALRKLGEPALLVPQIKVSVPTFRLLEMGRRPRSARIIFDQEDGGATVVLKNFPPAAARSAAFGGKPLPDAFFNSVLPGVLGLDPQRGLQLRALVDDQDRFWNGASDPPDWGQITADARNAIYVTADGWSVLLEGRIGPKRHAILRFSPSEDSWLGRISQAVFGRGGSE